MTILKDLKVIWEYFKNYKKNVYIIFIFALIGSIILAFIPLFFGQLVDIVKSQPDNLNLIITILFIWLLLNLIGIFLNKKANLKGGYLATDIYADFFCKTSSHIMRLPLTFHREKKIGEIYSKIERAAGRLYDIITQIFFWTFPQFLTALIGIFILFLIQWQLGLGALFIFLSYILITIYKTQPIIITEEKYNQVIEKVSGNFCDTILNTQIVKSCTAEKFQEEKIKKDYKEKLTFISKNLEQLWSNISFLQQIFFTFSFVTLFGIAIFFLRNKWITVGELVMFFGYLNLIRAPLQSLSWQWQMFKTGMTAINRIESFLKIPVENYNEKGKVLKNIQGKVEFKNIDFTYKEGEQVLENISFIAQPGEVIALVGGSGQGKTTLVDLISLYFIPSNGKILVDDVDIKKLNLQFLREKIAYVFQEVILFNDTIKNNILLGNPGASDEEIINATKAANAHQFIENFPNKYEEIIGEKGLKLSTGQKQRIAIAQALIQNAKIIILDEATSALDSESEKQIQEALSRLIKGRTIFIIAHRLSTVKKADKILVLKKGKIIEQGTHQELIEKKGEYFNFYFLQQENLLK